MKDPVKSRRQQFLLPAFYQMYSAYLAESESFWRENLPEGDSLEQRRSLASASVAEDMYRRLSLDYTAGVSLEALRDGLGQVVSAYEAYSARLAEAEASPDFPAFRFAYEIDDYERCMQLIGLCYLLHRRDLLPRIAKLQDPSYAGEDTLYEELLGHALPDRADVDEWYHDEPYSTLIHAMYADTPEDASATLSEYCREWYPAMESAPWHGSHERITEDNGDYFGYWAFEAGAVAYLYGIDDSQIDHMVYPRDLVAFARSFQPEAGGPSRVERVPGGKSCPHTGWWYTPARAGSRKMFKAGDKFPIIDSDYGDTFWLWSPDQSAPTL